MKNELAGVENVFITSAILIIPRTLFRGVILYFCWLWFAVPYGLPPVDYWTCVVVSGVVATLTFEHIGETKTMIGAFTKMVEWLIGISAFFGFAIIIHLGIVYG